MMFKTGSTLSCYSSSRNGRRQWHQEIQFTYRLEVFGSSSPWEPRIVTKPSSHTPSLRPPETIPLHADPVEDQRDSSCGSSTALLLRSSHCLYPQPFASNSRVHYYTNVVGALLPLSATRHEHSGQCRERGRRVGRTVGRDSRTRPTRRR